MSASKRHQTDSPWACTAESVSRQRFGYTVLTYDGALCGMRAFLTQCPHRVPDAFSPSLSLSPSLPPSLSLSLSLSLFSPNIHVGRIHLSIRPVCAMDENRLRDMANQNLVDAIDMESSSVVQHSRGVRLARC